MPNLLMDPGFEFDSAAWTIGPVHAGEEPYGERVQTPSPVHSGAWSVKLRRGLHDGGGGIFIDIGGRILQGSLPLVVGRAYAVSLWVYGNFRGPTKLEVLLDRGDGALGFAGWRLTTPPAGWSLWAAGAFTAIGTVGRLQWSVVGSTGQYGTWYVDDAAAGKPEDLMIEQIRAGLLAKLQGISVANGYLTDPAVVTSALLRMDQIEAFPALILRHAGFRSDDRTSPFLKLNRDAYWVVICRTKEEDPTPDSIENLIRDVTNAVETDQTLGGLDFVQSGEGRAVAVVEGDPVDLPADIERGRTEYGLLVKTSYLAPQGTL